MNLIQSEMKKRLEKLGCATSYCAGTGYLKAELDGKYVCEVQENQMLYSSEFRDLRDKISEDYHTVGEYVKAYENAPPLGVGVDNYQKLCDFNNIVLAAKVMENSQFEFVVWSKSYDGRNVCNGDYIYDYNEAKRDFAVRSGLVPKGFSQDELKTIHTALKFTQENSEELSVEEFKTMGRILEIIEDKCPDLAVPDESPKMGGL